MTLIATGQYFGKWVTGTRLVTLVSSSDDNLPDLPRAEAPPLSLFPSPITPLLPPDCIVFCLQRYNAGG